MEDESYTLVASDKISTVMLTRGRKKVAGEGRREGRKERDKLVRTTNLLSSLSRPSKVDLSVPRHDESRDSTLSSTLILPRLALRQSCSIGLQVLQLAFLSFRTDDNCLFSFRFFFSSKLSLSLSFSFSSYPSLPLFLPLYSLRDKKKTCFPILNDEFLNRCLSHIISRLSNERIYFLTIMHISARKERSDKTFAQSIRTLLKHSGRVRGWIELYFALENSYFRQLSVDRVSSHL